MYEKICAENVNNVTIIAKIWFKTVQKYSIYKIFVSSGCGCLPPS